MFKTRMGELRLTLVNDGGFGLDGGAMFGVVPRVLWQRKKAPDAENRIPMTTSSLLVERGSDLLLVETGVGDKMDERGRRQLGMADDAVRLPDAIRAAGYELGDVTHVLLTHLHFDHCGWNTSEDKAGRWVPTFPNARTFMARGEVEHARNPNVRDGSSYDPRNWEPLFEAGVVELFDDEAEPLTGVRAVRVPGHNADMCIVLLEDDGETRGVFWADLIPTSAHLPITWTMGYDLYPVETMANKELWLPRAAAGNWLCFFVHDPDVPVARLSEERPGRYRPDSVV